jgi:hypothetical protein
VGNLFKDLKKNVSRIWDDIEDEAKRVPKNVLKHGEVIGPLVSVIPGVGPILGPIITTAGTLGKGLGVGGSSSVLQYDPTYNTGSTPLGYGAMAPGPGGYQGYGSQPTLPGVTVAGGSWFEQYKTELMIGGALVLLIVLT